MLWVSGLWLGGDLTDEANDAERYAMKTATRDNEDVTWRDALSYSVKHLSPEEKVIPSLECCLIWPHLAFPDFKLNISAETFCLCMLIVHSFALVVWQAVAILAGISC